MRFSKDLSSDFARPGTGRRRRQPVYDNGYPNGNANNGYPNGNGYANGQTSSGYPNGNASNGYPNGQTNNGYPNGQSSNGYPNGNGYANGQTSNGYPNGNGYANGQSSNGYPNGNGYANGQASSGYPNGNGYPNGQTNNGYQNGNGYPNGQANNGYPNGNAYSNGYANNGYSDGRYDSYGAGRLSDSEIISRRQADLRRRIETPALPQRDPAEYRLPSAERKLLSSRPVKRRIMRTVVHNSKYKKPLRGPSKQKTFVTNARTDRSTVTGFIKTLEKAGYVVALNRHRRGNNPSKYR